MDEMYAAARENLVGYILEALKEPDGRHRAEEVLSAAAAIVGERCIDAAGDYPLRTHGFIPGSGVFSDSVNSIICGDPASPEGGGGAGRSILGTLRERLPETVFPDDEFPSLEDVFKGFAAGIGNDELWGWVPLSIPEGHRPLIPPLRVGYETRRSVDAIFSEIREDKLGCAMVAGEALADILMLVEGSIDHRIALALAIETVNGMAKTAPMTDEAMKELAQ